MRLLAAMALAALIPACAAFHPEPLASTQTLSQLEKRSLQSQALRQFLEKELHRRFAAWPRRRWDFEMLMLAALYYHPDLDVARAHWEVSKARIVTASGRPNPTLGLDPEFVTNAARGISPWILGLALDVPVETASRRGHRIARARDLSEAERLRIATTAWHVRSRLRATLLRLFSARRKQSILKRQLDLQRETVTLLEQRLRFGQVSRPDVTEAHIAVHQLLLSLRQADKDAAEARVQLAAALGLTSTSLNGVSIAFGLFREPPPLSDSTVPQIRGQAVQNRPDLLAALAEYAASQANLRLEISRQYPNLHIGPGYLFDQGDQKWALRLGLTLPIFNRNQGPIAEAAAQRTEAAARFLSLQADVLAEIDQAMAGYRAARRKLATADSLLASERQQLLAMQQMVAVGEADQLSLQSARLEVGSAELQRLDALVEAQRSYARLEDAVQRPLRPTEPGPAVPEKNPRPRR